MDFREKARFAAEVRSEATDGASAATMGAEDRRVDRLAASREEMRIFATDVM